MGTCQSLTESSSLVKELIDNALDANATSVAIEISANALDIVQVKDNGHGIALEDRGAMAVRYSTSKIIDVQELKVLGGRSLGFRGEALSSACEMAGEMVITTRVEGEGVAEACRIDRKGNIEIRERASHPVGTTVRILDFLKDLPVRREHALKNSTKTLAKIKHTMQAYAFARPNIRFSLRILKSGKGNWSYTPKRKAPPQLDPSLIIGKDAARECIWLTYPSPTGDDRRGVCDNNYSIEAFVPKPNADLSKISGKGQFISIDSRPVSCARGTLKQISSLFRSFLRSSNLEGPVDKLTDPFICMNVICPPGSYDVNIEPTKDDVLFGESSALLSVVQGFFQVVYGDLKPQAVEPRTWKTRDKERNGFDILLARKSQQTKQNKGAIVQSQLNETAGDGLGEMLMAGPNDSVITVDNSQAVNTLFPKLDNPRVNSIRASSTDRPETVSKNHFKGNGLDLSAEMQNPWKFNMYEDIDEDDGGISSGHCDHDETGGVEGLVQDIEENTSTIASNPWTIAKMNSPAHLANRHPPVYSLGKLNKPNTQLPSPAQSPQHGLKRPGLCQPSRQKNLNKETLNDTLIDPTQQRLDFSLSTKLGPSSSPSRSPHERNDQDSFTPINKERGSPGTRSLGACVQRPRSQLGVAFSGSAFKMTRDKDASNEEAPSPQGQRTSYRQPGSFVSARMLPLVDLPIKESHQISSVIPRISKQKRQGFLDNPSVPPIQGKDRNWFQISPSQSGGQPRSRAVKDSIVPNAPASLDSDSGDLIEEPIPRKSVPAHQDMNGLLDYDRTKLQVAKWSRVVREVETPEGETSGTTNISYLKPTLHNNPYQAAKESSASVDASPPSFKSGDPRAYLIRFTQPSPTSGAMAPPRRLGRAKTMMLPLETVPMSFRVHNLGTVIRTTVGTVERAEEVLASSDSYVVSGRDIYAFPPGLGGLSEIEAALREMLRKTYQNKTRETADLNIDLKMLMGNDLQV